MLESDGIDDVTLLVNSSPSKMMGVSLVYNNNGFPSVSSSVLCAKASMLLQVCILILNQSGLILFLSNFHLLSLYIVVSYSLSVLVECPSSNSS